MLKLPPIMTNQLTEKQMAAVLDDAPHAVRWEVRPVDQGQMVEIARAKIDGYVYLRVTDRSEQTVRYEYEGEVQS